MLTVMFYIYFAGFIQETCVQPCSRGQEVISSKCFEQIQNTM